MQSISHLKQELMDQQEASQLFGIQQEHGLSQILGGIHQTFSGEFLYPSVYERAAHMFYFTLKDHPFVDGNKRIGAHAMLIFLSINGVELDYSQKELVEIILATAAGEVTVEQLCRWILIHEA